MMGGGTVVLDEIEWADREGARVERRERPMKVVDQERYDLVVAECERLRRDIDEWKGQFESEQARRMDAESDLATLIDIHNGASDLNLITQLSAATDLLEANGWTGCSSCRNLVPEDETCPCQEEGDDE